MNLKTSAPYVFSLLLTLAAIALSMIGKLDSSQLGIVLSIALGGSAASKAITAWTAIPDAPSTPNPVAKALADHLPALMGSLASSLTPPANGGQAGVPLVLADHDLKSLADALSEHLPAPPAPVPPSLDALAELVASRLGVPLPVRSVPHPAADAKQVSP